MASFGALLDGAEMPMPELFARAWALWGANMRTYTDNPAAAKSELAAAATLFGFLASAEELSAQWRIFTPVLHELVAQKVEPAKYAYGSRGPSAADKLARRYGMTKFGGGLTPYVFVGDLLAGKEDESLVQKLSESTASSQPKP